MKNNTYIKIYANVIDGNAHEQIKLISDSPAIKGLVAIMPDVHFGKGSVIGFTGKFGDKVIPNIIGVDIGCFSGDTKVPLLNGTEKTLKELTKEKKPFYVYSINKNQEITGGKSISKKTRKNTEIIKIILDNGKQIKCTPEHKFMLRDGSYCEAKDLKINQSLMPLNRQYDKENYESVYNPKTKTYQRTHWILARTGVLGKIPIFKNQKVIIHHSNFNQKDNEPKNLKFMGNKNHSKYHRNILERNTHWQSKEFERKRIASIKKKIKTDKNFLEQKQKQGKINILKYMSENREEFLEKIKDNGKRGKRFLIKYNQSKKGRKKSKEIANRLYKCDICGEKIKSPIGLYHHKKKEHNNHKVAKVIKSMKKEDVYCLMVEKHHNFALSSGVFVHNCGVISYPLKKIEIDFKELDKHIRENIPLGYNKRNISEKELLAKIPKSLFSKVEEAVKIVIEKSGYCFENQIGTLGGGNHFIEIGEDKDKNKYLLIHSGSRNFGKQVAEYHQKKAVALCKSMGVGVAKDLEYLPLEYGGNEYLIHMKTAQEFASLNREAMLKIILRYLKIKYIEEDKIESIHNFIAEDNIIRKGAIQSYGGQKVVIPFNMSEGSVIGVGKSNKDYNFSAPHGSGRVFGRNVMKNKLRSGEITMQDFKNSMKGIFSTSIKESTIDESKFAYKTFDDIKEHLEQTIDIQIKIKPIYNLKSD